MIEKPKPSWWRAVPNTGAQNDTIVPHPAATLDAQAARLMKARHTVTRLDIDIQCTDATFKKTVEDIEEHYHRQLDAIEREYAERSSELQKSYRDAYSILAREQGAMAEQLKQVDCRAEFVTHFPKPKEEPESSDGPGKRDRVAVEGKPSAGVPDLPVVPAIRSRQEERLHGGSSSRS